MLPLFIFRLDLSFCAFCKWNGAIPWALVTISAHRNFHTWKEMCRSRHGNDHNTKAVWADESNLFLPLPSPSFTLISSFLLLFFLSTSFLVYSPTLALSEFILSCFYWRAEAVYFCSGGGVGGGFIVEVRIFFSYIIIIIIYILQYYQRNYKNSHELEPSQLRTKTPWGISFGQRKVILL